MKGTMVTIAWLSGMVLYGPAAFSQDPHEAGARVDSPTLQLSPKIRGALIAEMSGLKEGIAELAVTLPSGEWGRTVARAERIRDSYIMKQKLSRAELEQLERSLPPAFQEMDAAFHRHAEGLAHAAQRRDGELAVFYFGKMMDGCVSCHARYATHTFTGLKPAAAPRPAH